MKHFNAKQIPARYEAMLGPNTNQLWIYDNLDAVYIDIPSDLLDELTAKFGNDNLSAERHLEGLCNAPKNPSWLGDTDHHYTDIEI